MSQGLQVPQHALPTTDPEEIERRIADLRTVEQWLSLNLNMLKATIQGLEIQKGTLIAVQSFRQAMGDLGKDAMDAAQAQASQWSPGQEAPSETPSTTTSTTADHAASSGADPDAKAQAALDQVASQAGWWWSSMQDQFNQLVTTAQAMQQAAEASPAAKTTKTTKTKAAPAKSPAAKAGMRKTPAQKASTSRASPRKAPGPRASARKA